MKNLLISVLAATVVLFTACSSAALPNGAPENVKTYLLGEFENQKSVTAKLVAAGFEIVKVAKVTKKKYPVVIFTNAHIKKLANRPTRGLLAGEMRIMINKKKKEIRVNNPLYFFKAILQEEYKVGDEAPVVEALMKAFPGLKSEMTSTLEDGTVNDLNKDFLAYGGISDYHYMIGMPYYHEQNTVGEADTVAELVAKMKKKAKKKLVYLIELAPNRYVAGLKLGKVTAKFTKKIGIEKSLVMPWQVLIEEYTNDEGKVVARATALDGKYRIALSYPLLSMVGTGSFAGIMSIPGAIEKDLKKYFK